MATFMLQKHIFNSIDKVKGFIDLMTRQDFLKGFALWELKPSENGVEGSSTGYSDDEIIFHVYWCVVHK